MILWCDPSGSCWMFHKESLQWQKAGTDCPLWSPSFECKNCCENRGGGYHHSEKGGFRVSSEYHLSQCRKHHPGLTVSVALGHAPGYGPCWLIQKNNNLKSPIISFVGENITKIPSFCLKSLHHFCTHLSLQNWVSSPYFLPGPVK